MSLIALVIGHKETSQGARNVNYNISEFEFNNQLAIDIVEKMYEQQIPNIDVKKVYRKTYRQLPDDINKLNPDFIISLHANAFNRIASGTEVLYYHKSTKGREVALILQKKLCMALNLPNRKIKAKSAEERGGYLLKYTKAPCIIAEPFFIDNDFDYERAIFHKKNLINAYVEAINKISSLF